jgi:hypothetical protein
VAARPGDILRFIARNSKRVAVTIAGGVLILVGLVLLVLPGPGIVVIALGFAVLGTEYAWAAAALERTRRTAEQAGKSVKRGAATAAQASWSGVRSVGRKITRR